MYIHYMTHEPIGFSFQQHLVKFYDISTFGGYIMPKSLYTYIKHKIPKQILTDNVSNETEFISLPTIK